MSKKKRKKPKIIVILIAYNTKEPLANFYKDLRKYYKGEVILVDNKSEDGTYQLAKKLGIEAYQNHKNLGYGGNLKRAISIALEKGADAIVDIHPDGEYLPSVLPAAIGEIEKGAEFILGNRFTTPDATLKSGMYFWKLAPIRFLNFAGNFVLGTQINDLHQGFRVYTRDMLSKLNYKVNTNSYLFSFELIAQAVFNGVQITEVLVETNYSGEKRGASLKHSFNYTLGTFKTLGLFLLAKSGLGIDLFDL